MSNSIRVYTQNNCPYCDQIKHKLTSYGMQFEVINVSEDEDGKMFLKERGHRTVPQVYYSDVWLNTVDTADFTMMTMFEAMRDAYDNVRRCQCP